MLAARSRKRFQQRTQLLQSAVALFDALDLSQDCLGTVDAYLTPELWLSALANDARFSNDVLRGEHASLARLLSQLETLLQNVARAQQRRAPALQFTAPAQASYSAVAYQPPVVYDPQRPRVSAIAFLKLHALAQAKRPAQSSG